MIHLDGHPILEYRYIIYYNNNVGGVVKKVKTSF